jgi:uncharacterized protein DUF11/WD40 repeat protein
MRKLLFVALMAVFVLPGNASASFPGQNGKIAFQRGGDIWTMNPDGSGQVNLTNDAQIQSHPAWSADGNKIAFEQGGQTWWMFGDGTNRTLAYNNNVPVNRFDPAWSPSGTRIAFLQGSTLYSMNPDGTGVFGIGFGQVNPDWSADGSLITVEEEHPDFPCGFNDLFVARADGTDEHRIVESDCNNIGVNGSTWSPDAQRIAFYLDDLGLCGTPCPGSGFFTVKPDGTDRQMLPAGGPAPAWSPDGTKIAYGGVEIHVMNANGTGDTTIDTNGGEPSWQPLPAASPAADVLTTIDDNPDPVKGGGELHYTVQAKNLVGPDNATGVTLSVNLPNVFYVSATPTQGSCSHASQVVTCNVGNLAKGATVSVDILVEAQPVIATTPITATATVSASQADPVPGNNTDFETTTVERGGYARPKGATPLIASLVPAYKQCGAGEAGLQHGSPLSYPSCGSPTLTSGYLTTGTPDANARGANFAGSIRYTAVGETVIDPTNGDQSDVLLDASLTDVRNKSDLSDYTGGLRVDSTLRITDRDQGAGGFTSATVQDIGLSFDVPCAATASGTVGGACILHSSVDAITPGVVKEQKRAIWELGQVRVFDGGPDANPTTANNTLFAVQGVFVP